MTRREMAVTAKILKERAVAAAGRVQISPEMALQIAAHLEGQLEQKGAA